MYHTKFVDTFIDHSEGKPLAHDSLDKARAYAKEVTNRRRGEVQILDGSGKVLEIWDNGVAKGGSVIETHLVAQ